MKASSIPNLPVDCYHSVADMANIEGRPKLAPAALKSLNQQPLQPAHVTILDT